MLDRVVCLYETSAAGTGEPGKHQQRCLGILVGGEPSLSDSWQDMMGLDIPQTCSGHVGKDVDSIDMVKLHQRWIDAFLCAF